MRISFTYTAYAECTQSIVPADGIALKRIFVCRTVNILPITPFGRISRSRRSRCGTSRTTDRSCTPPVRQATAERIFLQSRCSAYQPDQFRRCFPAAIHPTHKNHKDTHRRLLPQRTVPNSSLPYYRLPAAPPRRMDSQLSRWRMLIYSPCRRSSNHRSNS